MVVNELLSLKIISTSGAMQIVLLRILQSSLIRNRGSIMRKLPINTSLGLVVMVIIFQ